MTAKEAFRNNLDRLIKDGETSPTALNKATGISRSTIKTWLDRSNSPNLEQVQRIAAAVGRTTTEMLAGEVAPAPQPKATPIEAKQIEAVKLILSLTDPKALEMVLKVLRRPVTGAGTPPNHNQSPAG